MHGMIKGIIFANQIDGSVTVDIDVFDIRNGKIGFGICNSWFRDVATACDVVRSVVISTGTVVRLIVVIVSTATFCQEAVCICSDIRSGRKRL